MRTIGFANTFYTLWDVSAPYKHRISQHEIQWRVQKTYIQNLSLSLEKAEAKLEGEYAIDLDLRGSTSFWEAVGENESTLKDYEVPFGRNIGWDIRECDDSENMVKLLWNVYLKKDIVFTDTNPVNASWKRPIVYARRQLFNLGILIKHDGQFMIPAYVDKYDAKKLAESLKMGFFFEEKEKVVVKLKEVKRFGFESRFGFTTIVTYMDKKGRSFKYMGASPKDEFDGFKDIAFTIKHSEYNGVKETKMLRMKIK